MAVLGFLFTLFLQYNGDFSLNFFNFLLFISYWISPFVGVVLADWWLRGRSADAWSIVDFARSTGTSALVALVVGFVAGIPFQNSSLGYEWGGPFNWVTPTTCTAPTWRTTSEAWWRSHLLVRRAGLVQRA